MTPEMIDEIESELVDRCGGWCVRIERIDPASADESMSTLAVMIVGSDGDVLAVEMRISEYGTAELTARRFSDGAPSEPVVFTSPGSVMIST